MKFLASFLFTLAFIPVAGMTQGYPVVQSEYQRENQRENQNKNLGHLRSISEQHILNIDELHRMTTNIPWQCGSILYIDTSLDEEGYEEVLHSALDNYVIILLDNTALKSTSCIDVINKMIKITGISVDADFVILNRKTNPPTLTLSNSPADVVEHFKELADNSFFVAQKHTNYFPGKSINIRLRRQHIPCYLYASTDFNKKIDYCDRNASIDVVFNVSMIRSVKAPDPGGSGYTSDAKYVRFSISEENGGGSGIHLRDTLIQQNVWYQSNINRHTRFGPYADSYSFSIMPLVEGTARPPGKILFSKPKNENPEYNMQESSTLIIGVNGSVGAQVGARGPTASTSVGASVGIINSRSLSWNTHEYRIRNSSSLDRFAVTWERDLDKCSEFINSKCLSTMGIVYGGPVFNEKKFNPIAYASFVPNLDVVYEAPPDATGRTTYRIKAAFVAKARFGRVGPDFFFGWYQGGGSSIVTQQEGYNIAVDWGHPMFEPEAHVKLRSLRADNLCLKNRNGAVYGTTCSDVDISQLWGLDSKERYKSLGSRGQCLGMKPDGSIYVGTCNNNLSQKWYWEDDKLISRFSPTFERWLLTLDKKSEIKMLPESEAANYCHVWRNELTNIF